MNQIPLEFAPDADTAGFRLHELSVYNWGTFHGKIHTIRPDGRTAILSGANASGKSTIADALLTLLVPNQKRNYNQAGQSQKKIERSEPDYVRGAYSEKFDDAFGVGRKLYLRKDPGTYTVLLAAFHNATLNSWVTLAQVLWLATKDKLDKVFIVYPRRLSIEGDFNNFEKPASIRSALKDRGIPIFETFTAYSKAFHEKLCMPSDKTPMEIFNQAICIKDITDLTSFIRAHMLDDGGAPEKLAKLRDNFTELRRTKRNIDVATRRLATLDLIKNDHDTFVILQSNIDELNIHEQILIPYFAEKEIALRTTLQGEQSVRKGANEAGRKAIALEIEQLGKKLRDIEKALNESDEGQRLQAIAQQIPEKTAEKQKRSEYRKKFDQLLHVWNPGHQVIDLLTFEELLHQCRTQPANIQGELDRLKEQLRQKESDHASNKNIRDNLEAEQRSLLDHATNIPSDYIKARAHLAKALKEKPDKFPFIGELVQVKSDETRWRGPIEHLLRDYALHIMVPSALRENVDNFLHNNLQPGFVACQIVPNFKSNNVSAPNHVVSGSVAGKLEIKPGLGTTGAWLAEEINRHFNHICCSDVGSRYQSTENALTANGVIKQNGTQRSKDDRHALTDAKGFVLGWDNRDKLIAISSRLKELESTLTRLTGEITSLASIQKKHEARLAAAEQIIKFFTDYAEMDWQSKAKEIADLEAERNRIKSASSKLSALEKQKNDVSQTHETKKSEERTLIGKGAILEQETTDNNKALEAAQQALTAAEATAKSNQSVGDFRSHYPAITGKLAFPVTDIAKLTEARDSTRQEITGQRNQCWKHSNQRSQNIKLKMTEFRMDADNAEFADRLAADYEIQGYNAMLYKPFNEIRSRIIDEDLPKNQKRFENLLHSTVTEDVQIFDELLTKHADLIEKKIAELNQQLIKIDFDRQARTYITLVPLRADETEVREFRNLRRNALESSLNATDDKEALKERYLRIEQLLDRLDQDSEWTTRVIDVRNWFVFRADEYYRDDGILKQSYSGASGKSGGEKNRLASTILATAIAYQYGISIDNRQTETFRLVAVDEMFSKTDDEFSKYLLELFKEFHLQLLIVQPLDAKIHLVEKYVERYHIVTKRDIKNAGITSAVHTLSVQQYQNWKNEQS